jgi:hypothetical protein
MCRDPDSFTLIVSAMTDTWARPMADGVAAVIEVGELDDSVVDWTPELGEAESEAARILQVGWGFRCRLPNIGE